MNFVNLSTWSKDELSHFFDGFDVIFTDCDGVLVRETSVINNSNLVINALLENQNKKVFIVSNNNQIVREDLLAKLQKLNFHLTIENILTSPYVTAIYLNSLDFNKKAFVIGSEQLGQELEKFGISHIGIGRDDMTDSYGEYMSNSYKLDENVGAVVVSLDKFFNIPKLLKAMNYLSDERIHFIATNSDTRSEFPGLVFPDAGPILAAVEAASKRKATVIGKPSTFMFDLLNLPVDKERVLMIGDRISVDIAFGKKAGIKTLLVESGDDKIENIQEADEFISDYVASDLGVFL